MRTKLAAQLRSGAFLFGLVLAGGSLTGCASIDESLFGSSAAPATPASNTLAATSAAAPTSDETAASTQTDQSGENPDNGAAPAPAAAPAAAETGITLAAIQAGSDTGTTVGQTVQRLRGELSTLHDKIAADLAQYGTLKAASTQDTTTYQEAKSHIVIRLQVGTTKGNPELVNDWNTGQGALDSLTTNINSFASLGTDLATDAGRARTERDTINDSFSMAGAVDEDHRQLSELGQESAQLVGAIDQLQKLVTQNIQRQTAFVANERGSLASLETAIKNGELYSTTDVSASAAPPAGAVASAAPGNAIMTIKFDHAHVDFEKDLYAALNQALQAQPSASFRVEAVAPTKASASAMRTAQNEAQHHAQDVLKSMTEMGVPATRVGISSSTDPSISASEVRVYVK